MPLPTGPEAQKREELQHQVRAEAAIDRWTELRQALDEADQISRIANPTSHQRDRLGFLLSKISALKSHRDDRALARRRRGMTVEERAFAEYFRTGHIPAEFRDMLEGTQSFLTWGEGPGGGYLVPQDYLDQVFEGLAQVDPLLDENNVELVRDWENVHPSADLQPMLPMRIVGWDLSQITSTLVAEGAQSVTIDPAITSDTLNGYTHRCAIKASFQFEQDAFPAIFGLLLRAYYVAFARGIGQLVATGTGSNQPTGLLTDATNSDVTTAAAGALSLDDFTDIYFSVNRIYRASPKCAWVMADETYQLARQAVDSNNRPLLSIERDDERILGKRVLVSPSMPSGAGSKGIVFGDLSHMVVRIGPMSLRRSEQTYATGGYLQVLYTGLMRADSALLDPTGGTTPPIVYATLHS